jgi:hypothetical protein
MFFLKREMFFLKEGGIDDAGIYPHIRWRFRSGRAAEQRKSQSEMINGQQ